MDRLHWILRAIELRCDLVIMVLTIAGLFFIAWLYWAGA